VSVKENQRFGSETRSSLLKKISEKILSIEICHPVRVGVDGITASGKSTFAKDLVEILRKSDRPVIYLTIDGFHNPKSIRYRLGRKSPEGYFRDAYDYESITEALLTPLGNGGSLKYCTETFNLSEDKILSPTYKIAEKNSIFVVDGSFSLRKELCDLWDYRIYLRVPFEVAAERASLRDKDFFGSSELAREVTEDRYHAAHRMHLKENRPEFVADCVVDNTIPAESFWVEF
jgi:uridine kinase